MVVVGYDEFVVEEPMTQRVIQSHQIYQNKDLYRNPKNTAKKMPMYDLKVQSTP